MCLKKLTYPSSSARHFKNGINFYYTNVVSLSKNILELNVHLEEINIDFLFIVVTEIRKGNFQSISSLLNGYKFYYHLAKFKVTGGVGIFVRNDVICQERLDLNFSDDNCENLTIEISIGLRKWLISVIYRHPSTPISKFKTRFYDFLEKIDDENKNCIIFGDFNIDLVNKTTSVQEYINNVELHNFQQLIEKPTRVFKNSSTLIDHIYFKSDDKDSYHYDVIDNSFSDHSSILFSLKTAHVHLNNRQFIRLFSQKNLNQFTNSLEKFTFDIKDSQIGDQNDIIWKNYVAHISNLMNENFPLKQVSRARANDKFWMTTKVKKMCKTKEILYNKFKKNPTDYRKSVYLQYKTVVQKAIYTAKREYYSNFLEGDKNNKRFWKHIKNTRIGSNANCIDQITKNSSFITDKEEIAQEFNQYFNEIAIDLSVKFADKCSFKTYLTKEHKEFVSFTKVNIGDVLSTIKSIKNKSSCGPNDISNNIVIKNSFYFSKILTQLINDSIDIGNFPSCLKTSKIIPVHKSGTKTLLSNYRPISLQCTFSKILEKIISKFILNHFESNNLLMDQQHGYRKWHNCQTALAVVYDHIQEKLSHKQFVIGIFLDLSKAFDTLNHDILFYKLRYYGFRGKEFDILKKYLSNRKHFTEVDNFKSTNLVNNFGVPQGSVLGPLLYSIYCNDISFMSNDNCKITLYADDTCLLLSACSITELRQLVNKVCYEIEKWFKFNWLTLNAKKSKFIWFNYSGSIELEIKFNEIIVENSDSINYLGIILQKNLKWNETIIKKTKTLTKLKYLFKHFSFYIEAEKLLMLYKSLVISNLAYGIELYGSTNKKYISLLQKLQNWFLKLILKRPKLYSTNSLHYESKILKICDLVVYRKCIFLFDMMNNYKENEYNKIINVRYQYQISKLNTRHKNNIFIGKFNKFKEKTVFYTCASFWNNLPEKLKCLQDRKQLKQELFEYLLSSYSQILP